MKAKIAQKISGENKAKTAKIIISMKMAWRIEEMKSSEEKSKYREEAMKRKSKAAYLASKGSAEERRKSINENGSVTWPENDENNQ